MTDIGSFYAQEREDGGVSGFWVAVAMEGGEERIAGCAGLGELALTFSQDRTVHSDPVRARRCRRTCLRLL